MKCTLHAVTYVRRHTDRVAGIVNNLFHSKGTRYFPSWFIGHACISRNVNLTIIIQDIYFLRISLESLDILF
jgi:hypothetical protein